MDLAVLYQDFASILLTIRLEGDSFFNTYYWHHYRKSTLNLNGFVNVRKGPSIKNVLTKSRKINPLPSCGHTLNFEKSEVFAKKCGH